MRTDCDSLYPSCDNREREEQHYLPLSLSFSSSSSLVSLITTLLFPSSHSFPIYIALLLSLQAFCFSCTYDSILTISVSLHGLPLLSQFSESTKVLSFFVSGKRYLSQRVRRVSAAFFIRRSEFFPLFLYHFHHLLSSSTSDRITYTSFHHSSLMFCVLLRACCAPSSAELLTSSSARLQFLEQLSLLSHS